MSTIFIGLCLEFVNDLFHPFSLSGLKVNYPVNLENYFCKFLGVLYVCLNIKLINKCIQFYTKLCDLINNCVHHEKSSRVRRLNMAILLQIVL